MFTVSHILVYATLLPMLSFLLLIFFGKRIGKASGPIATVIIIGALGLSVFALIEWVGKPQFNDHHYVEASVFRWMPIASSPGETNMAPRSLTNVVGSAFVVGILVDSLAVMMFIVVTLVASVVHLFSVAYMAEDPRYPRFFAYLGLFCFSMLALIISNSLLQMFICWELVGVCSFLLIGFWFEKRGPAKASVKAMVVNRIGDAAFLIGLGILLSHLGATGLTLFDTSGHSVLAASVGNAVRHEVVVQGGTALEGISQLAASESFLMHNFGVTFLGLNWLTWAGICIFGGAVAKSAQFPLHVWLPDAIEGPTPVSALIHAATMVAAGVYLVARVYPILTMDARLVVSLIGCTTLLMGALIAIVQTDIKKVLAYSTISQLGYMILFLGAGGYTAGLFHLFTHAFFKACLFLGAGSVIHALHHEQDLRQMGGLWRRLPITAGTFLLSVLAISGTPFFAGYYSKELGLGSVWMYADALKAQGHGAHYAMLLFWVPTITSFITAFYMWRCWWLAFGGKPRNEELAEHAHESPLMTLGLIILGVLAVIAGYPFFHAQSIIEKSLPDAASMGTDASFALAISAEHVEESLHKMCEYAGPLVFSPPIIGEFRIPWAFVFGPALALLIYFRGFGVADRIRRLPLISLIYVWLREKMYFDALYDGVIVNLTKAIAFTLGFFDKYGVDGLVNLVGYLGRLTAKLCGIFDFRVVDGLVNGAAAAAQFGGRGVLTPQGGRIRVYVLGMFTAVAVVIALVIFFAYVK